MSYVLWCIFSLLLNAATIKSEIFKATMPGAFPQKADDYICTRIPLPQFKFENGYVTAFKPVVNSSVHHIILSACNEWLSSNQASTPGPCLMQCRTHILYAWAHHGDPLILPAGSAFEIGRNSAIKSLSMEVHYSRREEDPDYATVELTFSREPQPRRAGIILLYNDVAVVPPHVQNFPTNISCRLSTQVPIQVIGVRTHAHDLNRGVYSYFYRPREHKFHLIAKGNAQWPQTFYRPSQLSAGADYIRLQDGDILMGRCVYDSMNRDAATAMGSTHADEMCNVYLMYTVDARFPSPVDTELCADEMVPGIWERAPLESLEYVTNTPPAQVDTPQQIAPPTSVAFVPDSDWSMQGESMDRVSGIAMTDGRDGKKHLFVLFRGDNKWTEESFDRNNNYVEATAAYLTSPIFHVDAESGRVLESFGGDLFVLPHGLSIAKDASGNPTALWVTDLARHQVFKFDWNRWSKPAMVLGQNSRPGSDAMSFCKPTDVAVATTGEIFVADGYCNQRVVKFSPSGDYITEWGVGGVDAEDGPKDGEGGFAVPHSLTTLPSSGGLEQVCVADRERGQIDCYDLAGHRLAQYGGDVLQPSVYAISFNPYLKMMFGLTGSSAETASTVMRLRAILSGESERDLELGAPGESAFAFRPLLGVNATKNAGTGAIRDINNPDHLLDLDLHDPHDVEVSSDGSLLFVAQLSPPFLSKFNIVESAKHGNTTQAEAIPFALTAITQMPRTLAQKIIITCALVILCSVVVAISLVLFRSRKSQVWNWQKANGVQRRTGGTRRGKWKRYDGFQPLHQDELRGLGSAIESDLDEDYDDERDGDATTIVDVRKLGPVPSVPLSTTSRNHATSASNHHIDT